MILQLFHNTVKSHFYAAKMSDFTKKIAMTETLRRYADFA